jgi:DNA-binding transcriptional LysR family regulator
MKVAHLRDVDLNLLITLDVLLREQSVTRTAAKLHVTQSAISHSLRRLRALFDDELLIRDGRLMRPTARAQMLAESLPGVLHQLQQLLTPPETFEPSTATRTFRLTGPDFIAGVMPDLLGAIQQETSRVTVEFAGLTPSVVRDLEQGVFDGLIAPHGIEASGLRGVELGASPWRVFGRAGHPAFDDWSPETWARWPHLSVATPGPSPGPIDRLAAAAGLKRRVAAMVPNFAVAVAVAAQTDMLLAVPQIAMMGVGRGVALDSRPIPVPMKPFGLTLYRSATRGQDPAVAWFLAHVQTALGGI